MTQRRAFTRSALFAAVAAAAWPVWAACSYPTVDRWSALALYLAAVTALYVAGPLAGDGAASPVRRPAADDASHLGRLRVALLAGGAAAAVAWFARNPSQLAIGLAAVLGVARSGFFYRSAPARAFVTEVTLLAGGLLFARFLAGPSLPTSALALWGFLLVQSFYFLVRGVRPRGPHRHADPFEEAHRRALALLGQ